MGGNGLYLVIEINPPHKHKEDDEGEQEEEELGYGLIEDPGDVILIPEAETHAFFVHEKRADNEEKDKGDNQLGVREINLGLDFLGNEDLVLATSGVRDEELKMLLQELISMTVLRVTRKKIAECFIQLLGLLVGVSRVTGADSTEVVLGLGLDTCLTLYLPEIALHEVGLRGNAAGVDGIGQLPLLAEILLSCEVAEESVPA